MSVHSTAHCVFLQVSLLFEVEDLGMASPASVSRSGMVYSDWWELGWEPYVKSWLNERADKVCVCVFVFAKL